MFSDQSAFRCPCCTAAVERPTAQQISIALGLPRIPAAIITELLKRPGEPVSTEVILLAMYRDEENPPDAARQYLTMKEAFSRLRKPLREIGLSIESCGYGAGWRAVWE